MQALTWLLSVLCGMAVIDGFHQTASIVTPRLTRTSLLDGSKPYSGPEQSFEEMIAGVQNVELGLNVMVGASTLGDGEAGLGVFVAVSDEVEQSTVKQGQPLMGYSKGTFIDNAEEAGDKTVAWLFTGVDQAIFFEKELMTLKDAMGIISNRHDVDDMTDLLLGHKLFFDEEAGDLAVTADEFFARRYFVPHEVAARLASGVDVEEAKEQGVSADEIYHGIDVSNMGMYVNDLAYSAGMTMHDYLDSSADKNILAIVWRLEDQDSVLYPSWPVVVTKRDVVFDNREVTMEMGLEYNWKYWHAYELKQKGSEGSEEG